MALSAMDSNSNANSNAKESKIASLQIEANPYTD